MWARWALVLSLVAASAAMGQEDDRILTVVDAFGDPIEGATVWMCVQVPPTFYHIVVDVGSTDADGRTVLAPESSIYTVWSAGHGVALAHRPHAGSTIRLPSPHERTVRVVSPVGEPIAGASVFPVYVSRVEADAQPVSDWTWVPPPVQAELAQTTGADGTAAAPWAGRYDDLTVGITAPGYGTVHAEVHEDDIILDLVPAGMVTITTEGLPEPGLLHRAKLDGHGGPRRDDLRAHVDLCFGPDGTARGE
ncbi:MAG: hypothetical protein GF320_11315, partial [Armatimonadia bacterium]|nr:hypothetical protein [Armatimonadia bacterium]